MIWTPHVTAAAVVERDGRFLLVEEDADGRVVLNQPAGHLDAGEGLLAAVARETLEETGWRFAPRYIVGIYLWRNPATDITYLRAAFGGELLDHDGTRALDAGIRRALWLTTEEIRAERNRHRSPQVQRCVDDYLAGNRFPLALLVDLDDAAAQGSRQPRRMHR